MAAVAPAPASVPETARVKLNIEVTVEEIELAAEAHIADNPDPSRYLVMSPYTEPEHLLNLETLDTENQILATALTKFECLREDYATSPYPETFNWPEVIDEVRELAKRRDHHWKESRFYIVAFRSQLALGTDYGHLGALDKAAHAEATAGGGFLKYWFGVPSEDLHNLATCVWRSRADAAKGGGGPAHLRAAGAARKSYTFWKIDRFALVIRDGVDSWALEEWQD